MVDQRKRLGDFGEQVAAAHLTRQGMTVLARKWRTAAGEIDLVLRDGAALVFAEVRTRRGNGWGQAEESIGRRKQARLIELAYAYLEAQSAPPDHPWRIDVVTIDLGPDGRVARLNHIRHAVEQR